MNIRKIGIKKIGTDTSSKRLYRLHRKIKTDKFSEW